MKKYMHSYVRKGSDSPVDARTCLRAFDKQIILPLCSHINNYYLAKSIKYVGKSVGLTFMLSVINSHTVNGGKANE